MRSAPGRSKDRYRQLDVSAARQAGLPFNGTLMLVTVDPDDDQLVNLTFDAPMLWIGLVDTTLWTFGAATVTGTENFTNGGRSMQCHLSAPVSNGDPWHMECAGEDNYLASINGGRVNTTDGIIAEPPATTLLQLIDVHMESPAAVYLGFDAPVALPANTVDAGIIQFDPTGWAIGSATIVSLQNNDGPNNIRVALTTSATTGQAFTNPGGSNNFVSLTGQPLAASTGVIG